jgi:hypothetical protein
VVDRAKSVLQRDLLLSEDEAYQKMQRESRQRRKSMREIAEAILLSDDLRQGRLGEPREMRPARVAGARSSNSEPAEIHGSSPRSG